MRSTVAIIASACCLLIAGAARAQALTVGVVAPLSGPNEPLGRQVSQGAGIAAKALGVEIRTADDACTAEGGAAAARGFADAKVDAVVGFLCTEAIEAALPVLKGAGIPVITVGVRAESLTDRRAKTGWPVWRLGPRGDDERNAAAALLVKRWRDDPFAIVDDGTIYGRELAETVRNATEQAVLKPVFIDTYRPDSDNQIGLVGRLKRAGATQVFVGGDGDDVAIMGRDAAQLDAGITFAGGEALRAAPADVAYAEGTMMVALPEWADVADRKTLDDFTAAGVIPEGYALPAYAAIEVAWSAAARAVKDGKPVAKELTGQDFVTAIGPIRFDAKGDLSKNPYRAFRFDAGKFVPLPPEGPVMFGSGARNLLTDVAGLSVGNAEDTRLKSGVTAILCDTPAVASVQVLGGAPGTRETDLLEPHNSVEAVNAIVLSGGSAFGLDAASGVQAALRERGVGFEVRGMRVPIVPGAILFDLINGGDKDWGRYPPYRELGYQAAQNAAEDFALGSVGAGTGALTYGVKGGLGSASTVLPGGITVAALVAVNAVGSATVGLTRHFWAAPWEIGDEFGGLGLPSPLPADAQQIRLKFRDSMTGLENTTIAVVATDAVLTKAAAKRLAIAAHDGFARAIWPAHTPMDGDLVFSLATGRSGIVPSPQAATDLYAAAGATMARAIARGVYAANAAENDLFPIWTSRR